MKLFRWKLLKITLFILTCVIINKKKNVKFFSTPRCLGFYLFCPPCPELLWGWLKKKKSQFVFKELRNSSSLFVTSVGSCCLIKIIKSKSWVRNPTVGYGKPSKCLEEFQKNKTDFKNYKQSILLYSNRTMYSYMNTNCIKAVYCLVISLKMLHTLGHNNHFVRW